MLEGEGLSQVSVSQALKIQEALKKPSDATSLLCTTTQGGGLTQGLAPGSTQALCIPPSGWPTRTSLISLILQPPFPMREPHWLAGTTSRRVTGGRLAAVLLVMELLMSCEEDELLRGVSPARCPRRNGTQGGDAPGRGTGRMTLAQAGWAKVTPGFSRSYFPQLC